MITINFYNFNHLKFQILTNLIICFQVNAGLVKTCSQFYFYSKFFEKICLIFIFFDLSLIIFHSVHCLNTIKIIKITSKSFKKKIKNRPNFSQRNLLTN